MASPRAPKVQAVITAELERRTEPVDAAIRSLGKAVKALKAQDAG